MVMAIMMMLMKMRMIIMTLMWSLDCFLAEMLPLDKSIIIMTEMIILTIINMIILTSD